MGLILQSVQFSLPPSSTYRNWIRTVCALGPGTVLNRLPDQVNLKIQSLIQIYICVFCGSYRAWMQLGSHSGGDRLWTT